ncbi:Plant invertase/pectin methylesterase inhibitor protein, partial [Quillaja saponaria]
QSTANRHPQQQQKMKPPSKIQALVLSAITLLLIINFPLPTTAASKLVESICKEVFGSSSSISTCVKSIEFDPRSSSATNFHDLAKFALEAAITNATDSQNYINEMAKRNSTEPIKKCASLYEQVISSFKNALIELDAGHDLADYYCLIASDYSNECETLLARSQIEVLSISSRNNIIKFYSYFSAATIVKLH